MDIVEFLHENNIKVWEQGKNISKGWIGLTCPFCNDDSNHLGIYLSDYRCYCWKCGGKNFLQVLRKLLDISYPEAKRLANDLNPYRVSGAIEERTEIKRRLIEDLPKEFSDDFPKLHMDYLLSRGFNAKKVIRQYKLKAVNHIGPWKFRIIIPIYKEKMLVSFTSRDVTGNQKPKYKAAPADKYPNPKHHVYSLDSIAQGGNCILVEGPTDVWKLGKGAISFFGVSGHGKQLISLKSKKINTLHVCFDNDSTGRKNAGKIARQIFPLVKRVNIVSLTDAPDPGSLTMEQGKLLMNTLDINPF